MAVADLVYTIAGDSSKFVRALQQADKQLERTTKGMSKLGKLGATLGAGIATAGTAVMELTRRSADNMAEIQKIADSSGVSTEQLSKLGYAASTVGLQLDDLRDAAFEVALKMGEAARGEGPAVDAFANIGVAVMDANGAMRESGDVMDDAIKKLAGIEHPATRAAAAAALLGDDVSLKMAPLLAQGSDEIKRMGDEAKELGLVFDEEAGKAALEFQGNLIKLQGAAQGLGNYLFQVFAPALNVLTTSMLENAKATEDMRSRQEAATGAMKAGLVVLRSVGMVLEIVSHWFAALGAGAMNEAQLVGAAFEYMAKKAKSSLDPRTWNAEGDAARQQLQADFDAALKRRNDQQAYLTGQRDRILENWALDIETILNAEAKAAEKKRDLFVGPQLFVGPTLEQAGRNPKPEQPRESPQGRGVRQVNQAALDAAAEAERIIKEMQETAQGIFDDTRTSEERAAQQFALRMAQIQEAQTAKLIDADTAARAIQAAEAERDREKIEAMAALQERGQEVRESLMSEAERAQAQIQAGIASLNELLAQGAIDQGVYALAVKKLHDELDPAAAKMRELEEAGKALAEQMRTPGEALTLELERINELLRTGAIDAETYDRALNNLFKKTKPQLTDMQQLTVDAAKSLSSSFSEFLFDPFNASLGDMVKNFALSLAKMVTDLLAKKAVLALLGAFGAPTEVIAATGFADGGLVSGPGTGTSDSIPARLSNGEYVMPADTVRHYGRDFMDALRAMRPQREAPVARFAEGGYVDGQGGGSGGGVRVVNVVDSSMVQDFLTSSAGEQVILNTIRRNRRQVSQVMA